MIKHTKLSRSKYRSALMRLTSKMEPGTLDPVDWANESYKLAHSNAYAVPQNGKLGQAYYRQNIQVVNERLAIGGMRLAAVLNDLYDPAEPAATQPE